jgi:hypothetical protein
MPEFLIIGAYKSGTTSLVDYLGQHPQIFLPDLQEPNYWSTPPEQEAAATGNRPQVEWEGAYRRPRARNREQYLSLFEAAPPEAVLGECSPEYLRNPVACPRIRQALPDVKLLAVLRDPALRTLSDYQARIRDGLETASLETAIERSLASTTAGSGAGAPVDGEALSPAGTYDYLRTSFYGSQLQHYVDTFPADQLRVLLTEDLREGGTGLRDTATWLGVDPDWTPDLSAVRNVSGAPRNRLIGTAYRLRRELRPFLKPIVPDRLQRRVDGVLAKGLVRESLTPETRARLVEIFRDDVLLLQDLLGRDLSAWLR